MRLPSQSMSRLSNEKGNKRARRTQKKFGKYETSAVEETIDVSAAVIDRKMRDEIAEEVEATYSELVIGMRGNDQHQQNHHHLHHHNNNMGSNSNVNVINSIGNATRTEEENGDCNGIGGGDGSSMANGGIYKGYRQQQTPQQQQIQTLTDIHEHRPHAQHKDHHEDHQNQHIRRQQQPPHRHNALEQNQQSAISAAEQIVEHIQQ